MLSEAVAICDGLAILWLLSLSIFLYFLLDQKVTKNQGLLKMAKNRAAILAGRNEVVTLQQGLKPGYTNLLSSALILPLAFLLYLMLPVFFTPFLEGRSLKSIVARPSLREITSLLVVFLPILSLLTFCLTKK